MPEESKLPNPRDENRGLVKALGGDSNTQVRILGVYLKPEDIDLDEI